MDMLSQIERKPKLTTASPMIVALMRIERTLSGVKSFGMNALVVELDMMLAVKSDVGLRLRKVGGVEGRGKSGLEEQKGGERSKGGWTDGNETR